VPPPPPRAIRISEIGVQLLDGIGHVRRFVVLAASLALVGAARGHFHPPGGARAQTLTLWAWERPEDLRFLHGSSVRVAFLDRTVRFEDSRLAIQFRHQPLLVSPDTALTAVVRIETRGRAPDPTLTTSTADAVIQAVHAGVSALQIDFDARRSDRPFYSALIKSVRARLPRAIPLSITALTSWCVDDPWIDTRDVDEIVPMLFQMGPDTRHVLTRLEEDGRWPVAACNGAAGLATDERHDRLPPAGSVYVFKPRAWTADDLRDLPWK
jgi:uncharacterized protein DUF3142